MNDSNRASRPGAGFVLAPNAHRLLWAGFMAIVASGVGFSVRANLLKEWSKAFGFTQTELGEITGGGLVGFGIIIILSSFIAERVGYGMLMILAFIIHFLSAVVTLAAPMAFEAAGKDAAYWCLFIGLFMFAIGNGVCEAVVNPLVATLFPHNKTHYLNILHAGWPAGLIIGGVASILMADKVSWQIQISLFLVPVILYGLMIFGQKMPPTEASAKGLTLGQMLVDFASPLLIFLLVIHALVGYVELGTDSWISRITGLILNESTGRWLFVYTSALMFILRFTAGPIVHKISPLGLLLTSAILATVGLYTLGGVETTVAALVALTIYGLGKTFFWPTMLAVASERFPRGGAVTLGAMGGIGMLSAGLLGAPAIGFKQDKFASENLREKAPAAYERYKADDENHFLFLTTNGLDGTKVSTLEDKGKKLHSEMEVLEKNNREDKKLQQLNTWWNEASSHAGEDEAPVKAATLVGGRMAFKLTAVVPAIMAVCYLILIVYFNSIGGYKPLYIDGEKLTGGVEGPMEG